MRVGPLTDPCYTAVMSDSMSSFETHLDTYRKYILLPLYGYKASSILVLAGTIGLYKTVFRCLALFSIELSLTNKSC